MKLARTPNEVHASVEPCVGVVYLFFFSIQNCEASDTRRSMLLTLFRVSGEFKAARMIGLECGSYGEAEVGIATDVHELYTAIAVIHICTSADLHTCTHIIMCMYLHVHIPNLHFYVCCTPSSSKALNQMIVSTSYTSSFRAVRR